ncbi:MAG: ACT domain-containing protein [Ruminococcaceae bacterium]|nr:ACT domain-containing protein [Oscillospiraceae bacterium]
MKAVITVTGKDNVGIIAGVSALCADKGANILDITQSVLSEYFAMIMLADIDALTIPFSDFVDILAAYGDERGLVVSAMHEDIFNTMHHI